MGSLKNPKLETQSLDLCCLTCGGVKFLPYVDKRRANLCWQPEGRTTVVTVLLTKDCDPTGQWD